MLEYVKTNHLKPGDIILRTLYDEKGRTLLRHGSQLTERSINIITAYGFKGMYIDNTSDTRRELIPISVPLIDDNFALQIISCIKDFTDCKQTGFDIFDPVFLTFKRRMDAIIDDVVNDLFQAEADKRLIYETEDLRTNKTWIYYHCLNVCVLSAGIAIKMGLNKNEVREIAQGGMYHDIGKVLIERNLVDKPHATAEERGKIRKHCELGFRTFQALRYPINVTYAIWHHHEHENGSGYPNGIKGDKIPLSAKIVCLASAYDNMINKNPTSDIVYEQNEAVEMVLADQRFNSEVVRAFTKFVMPFPIGMRVKMSNGETAFVLQNHAELPLRPIVCTEAGNLVDLCNPNNCNITIQTDETR